MIKHHPEDDLLLALAAGRLASGPALLVAVHLESCPACRARLHTLQALGGALLEAAEPHLLAPEALGQTLARIDSAPPPAAPAGPPTLPVPAGPPTLPVPAGSTAFPAPALPGGAPWPQGLRGCAISPWRWMAPGMRFARVRLPHDPQASLYLLKIAPGRSLPRHTHTELELTQVLSGSFDDGRAIFAAGDFDAADPQVHHQPVVAPGDECVCLAFVDGRLRFDGRIAATIGGWIGM